MRFVMLLPIVMLVFFTFSSLPPPIVDNVGAPVTVKFSLVSLATDNVTVNVTVCVNGDFTLENLTLKIDEKIIGFSDVNGCTSKLVVFDKVPSKPKISFAFLYNGLYEVRGVVEPDVEKGQ